MTEVRIYVEGGGDQRQGKADLRRGFGAFLSDLREKARAGRTRWSIIPCGGRDSTFEDFKRALSSHPDALNVLLVDSEDAVKKKPWEHLKDRDKWDSPGCPDDVCHLMVQTMESWLVADPDALQRFYGNGFKCNALPTAQDIEGVAKKTVADSLKSATRDAKTKGEYRKLQHGPKLLGLVDSGIVRSRARHCDRLFSELEDAMSNP